MNKPGLLRDVSRKASATTGPMDRESTGKLEPHPASTLCHRCFHILHEHENSHRFASDGFIVFHRIWAELHTGSETGCQLCTLLTSNLKSRQRRIRESIDTTSGRQLTFKLGKGREDRIVERFCDVEHLDVQVRVSDEGQRHWEWLDDMTVAVVEGDPAATYVNRRPSIYDLASNSSCEISRQWITNCGASHRECPLMKPSPLPTRVVDVGNSTCDLQKLLITNGVSAHYAALSYCWGIQPQPLVTTESNLNSLCHDIPASSLLQSIQDAIFLTRKLGFRYLWVDALCIVQDSAIDKAHEITRMGEVYQSAAITLIAASAKSCHEGFLHHRYYPRGPQEWQTFNLPFRCPDGSLGELTLEPRDTYYTGDQPINHRAWTLQESLLSPRKLIYSTTHLVWQCQSNETTLGSRARKPDSRPSRSMSIQISPILTAAKYDSTHQEMLQAVHKNWGSIVQAYSRRKLTNNEDILPAISGIAAKFAAFLNEQYKAGHWYNPSNESTFVRDLLWYREEGRSREDGSVVGSELYTAPSWSWASQQRTAFWVFHLGVKGEEVLCEVEECVVELATVATYGQVKTGSLRLRARIRRLEKVDTGNAVEDLVCLITLLEVEGVEIRLDDEIETLAKKFKSGPLSCILLTMYGGLLLVPQTEGKWVRIGIFHDRDRKDPVPGHVFNGWFEDERVEVVTIV